MSRTAEQRLTEQIFQALNLTGERRLRHAEAFCGPAKIKLVRNSQKALQLLYGGKMTADKVRGDRHNTILLRKFGGRSERITGNSNGEGNPSPFYRLHALDGVDTQSIQTLLQRLRRQRGQLQTAQARCV